MGSHQIFFFLLVLLLGHFGGGLGTVRAGGGSTGLLIDSHDNGELGAIETLRKAEKSLGDKEKGYARPTSSREYKGVAGCNNCGDCYHSSPIWA